MKDKLNMGISRQDITPKVGARLYGYRPDLYSESINDNLSLTAFGFCQGEIKALMISISVCLIKTELATELRREIEKNYGVDFNNIIISATHTHTAPCVCETIGWGGVDEEYYNDIFKPAVLRAAEEALKNMQPVTVAVVSGNSDVGINRRQLTLDNEVTLKPNRWSVYNPEMTVISFKDESNNIIGNIIHYGCHGTAAGALPVVSRDWPGIMTDCIEKKIGGFTAFFNGCEGDVGPRLSNGSIAGRGLKYVYEHGEKAARDALNIFDQINEYKEADISVKTGILKLPLKPRISREEAVKGMESFDENMININLKTYSYFKEIIESYDNGYEEKEFREVEQTIIKIGDIVFVSFPYEPFSEIGMRIDDGVEGLRVLSLSNSNGSESYFVTQDQLCRGGYEVDMFKYADIQSLTDDADFQLIKETLRNMEDLIHE